MGRERLEVEVPELLRTGQLAKLTLLDGKTLDLIARGALTCIPLAGEPLRQILFRRRCGIAERLLLRRVLLGLPQRKVAVGEHRHGTRNLLDVGELRDQGRVGLDRTRTIAIAVDCEGAGELHFPDLLLLSRRDRRLDLLAELLLHELLNFVREVAGIGSDGRLRILHKHVDHVIVGTRVVALATLFGTEEQIGDLGLVGLRLLHLALNGVPHHLAEQIAALGHRAHAGVTILTLWVLLEQTVVDLGELRHVVVDQILCLLHVATQHLDVRLHGDGLAEHDDQLVFPEKLVGELRRAVEISLPLVRQGFRLLRVRGKFNVLRKADEQGDLLHCHRAPALFRRTGLGDLSEQAVVHLHGLVEVLLVHADLRPLEARFDVEVDEIGTRLLHCLEELFVDLPTVVHHATGIVGIGHRKTQRPVFAVLRLHGIDDLLHFVELAETQRALELQYLQLRRNLRPLLLRGIDHGLGEVRHIRVDKGANVHAPVGKLSFTAEQLIENVKAVIDSVIKNKPQTAKGTYIKSLFLTATMTPSLKLDMSLTR